MGSQRAERRHAKSHSHRDFKALDTTFVSESDVVVVALSRYPHQAETRGKGSADRFVVLGGAVGTSRLTFTYRPHLGSWTEHGETSAEYRQTSPQKGRFHFVMWVPHVLMLSP